MEDSRTEKLLLWDMRVIVATKHKRTQLWRRSWVTDFAESTDSTMGIA